MRKTVVWLCALLALLVGATHDARAQQHPNQELGFHADKVFASGDVDAVNVFNGNLVVSLPIGGSYPTSTTFDYGLTLVYNSNPWIRETNDLTGAVTVSPNTRLNAGMGWMLSPGFLITPDDPTNHANDWVYLAPDGSERVFRPELHPGNTPPGAKYTRDGTYLRLIDRSAQGTMEVHFPNGEIHTFRRWLEHTWRLSRMENRLEFGANGHLNWVNVADVTRGGQPAWQFTDSLGRVQYVVFRSGALGPFQRIVDRVELQAFAGQTAIYQFNYSPLQTIVRDCGHNASAQQIAVPFLESVTLPDGSSYQMPVSTSYYTPTTVAGCLGSGRLERLKLPTGGALGWEYGTQLLPGICGDRNAAINAVTRVTRRHKYEPSSSLPVGTWTYDATLAGPIQQCGPNGSVIVPGPSELTVQVTSPATPQDPIPHYTKHYFSVSRYRQPSSLGSGAADEWDPKDYGMPFTRDGHHGRPAKVAGKFLSSQLFDGRTDELKSSEYVLWRYENGGQFTSSFEGTNRRLEASRTEFNDWAILGNPNNPRYVEVLNSGFDQLGHYRTSTRRGNFAIGGRARTTTTHYALTAVPTATEDWILDRVDYTSVTEDGATAYTDFCLDGKGQILRTRMRQNPGQRGDHDVVLVFDRDDAGNVTRERWYGGDNQSVDDGAGWCHTSPASVPEVEMRHGHASGRLAWSRYFDPSTGLLEPHYELNLTIDPGTGLVSKSKDVSLIETSYDYDRMGRVTWIKPQAGHDAWQQVEYTPHTGGTSRPRVKITSRPNGSTGGILTEQQFHYDPWGRIAEEWQRLPTGAWSKRGTAYDIQGRKLSESTWGNGPFGPATRYKKFDVYGRAEEVISPDGFKTVFWYSGPRNHSRRVKAGTMRSGNTVQTNTIAWDYEYDVQGRLVKVKENSAEHVSSTINVATEYRYDVGNRLRLVRTRRGGAYEQEREFNYDLRGFLLSEKHPELGSSGNGSIFYRKINSQGRALERDDGRHTLRYDLDASQRPTRVWEPDGGSGRTWKTWTFGSSNGGVDRRLGKVIEAHRFNYLQLGANTYEIDVKEIYRYLGIGGRRTAKSQRITTTGPGINWPTRHWNLGFTFDELGQMTSESYPDCLHSPCSSQAGANRTVSYGYNWGSLTSVSGFASSLTYHDNRQLASIVRTNGVVDVIGRDAAGMGRPGSFTAQRGVAPLWATGAYQYDGAGNVIKIGSDTYLYDKANRLKESRQTVAGVLHEQAFDYDVYGNLFSKKTTVGSSTSTDGYATDPLTNHWSVASYDASGNVTAWQGNAYQYDPFNQITDSGNGEQWYFYGPGDERIWTIDRTQSPWLDRFTLRGLNDEVLRTFTNTEATAGVEDWAIESESIYRGSQLLAKVSPEGTHHLTLDHLGTPRLITDGSGQQVAQHHYYPYGGEITDPNGSSLRQRFTGHERDFHGPGSGDDLDYMHARYSDPEVGRFLQVDPKNRRSALKKPQVWNRYVYGVGSPLVFVDPDGREEDDPPDNSAKSGKRIDKTKGNYRFVRFPYDSYHGGEHVHVYDRRGGKLHGRVSTATGEVVDRGSVPKKALKLLKKLGLVAGRGVVRVLGPVGVIWSIIDADDIEGGDFTPEELALFREMAEAELEQEEVPEEAEEPEDDDSQEETDEDSAT